MSFNAYGPPLREHCRGGFLRASRSASYASCCTSGTQVNFIKIGRPAAEGDTVAKLEIKMKRGQDLRAARQTSATCCNEQPAATSNPLQHNRPPLFQHHPGKGSRAISLNSKFFRILRSAATTPRRYCTAQRKDTTRRHKAASLRYTPLRTTAHTALSSTSSIPQHTTAHGNNTTASRRHTYKPTTTWTCSNSAYCTTGNASREAS